jgi:hypothetical protein
LNQVDGRFCKIYAVPCEGRGEKKRKVKKEGGEKEENGGITSYTTE